MCGEPRCRSQANAMLAVRKEGVGGGRVRARACAGWMAKGVANPVQANASHGSHSIRTRLCHSVWAGDVSWWSTLRWRCAAMAGHGMVGVLRPWVAYAPSQAKEGVCARCPRPARRSSSMHGSMCDSSTLITRHAPQNGTATSAPPQDSAAARERTTTATATPLRLADGGGWHRCLLRTSRAWTV